MAIGIIFQASGVTQAQYEQVLHTVMPGDQPPAGMLHHAAGPSESGWCVTEVWESQEALDRFFHDTLGAALQAAGITVQPSTFEIVKTIAPS